MLDWCHTVEQNRAVYLGEGWTRGKCGIFGRGVGSWSVWLVRIRSDGRFGMGFWEEWGLWEGRVFEGKDGENKHFL